ncbi:MAG: zinc ribbon domain-containing protein, partial [Acidocella sp.]|nr:zinc ribbon domain-containing protein [Acidocella sp.]
VLTSFLSGLLEQWPDQKILCLVHVKELLAQAFKTLIRIWPEAPATIYSAGLGSKNLRGSIVFAGIQSIYKKAYNLQRVDLVIVDEVDMIPHDGEGMYRKLLADLLAINPDVKVIGLTATPWRTNGGLITEGDGAIFHDIAYEVELKTLLDGGWICPPVCKTMDTQIDTSGVAVRGGEFVSGALEKAADKEEITKAAVTEIIALGQDRHSWLVFASGVEHSHHIRDEFRSRGVTCEAITGKTAMVDRDRWIAGYQAGKIKCLVNVGVLTVGFDAPATDLLAILRPTKSSRLWLQVLGRGFRLSPATGKTDFLVLDYTDNSRRFGPIDLLRPKSKKKGSSEPGEAPAKVCPECEAEMLISSRECLACGYVFPEAKPNITAVADTAPLLSSQMMPAAAEWVDVTQVTYARHKGKDGKPDSLRAEHWCGMVKHSEWVCLEHPGYARDKAYSWWRKRVPDGRVPMTVDEALAMAPTLPKPSQIQVKKVAKYTEIVAARFG